MQSKGNCCRGILRVFCGILCILYASEATAIQMTAEARVKDFVESTEARVLQIIQSRGNEEQKLQQLQKTFDSVMDIEWMGQFALGRASRQLTPSQRERYNLYYKKYLMQLYVPKFREYNGQKMAVSSIRPLGNDQYIVSTQIMGAVSNDTKVNVAYKCKLYNDGHIMFRDIVGENVSLISTQRSEFNALIGRDGIDALIALLKNKSERFK